jgi:hypothetical protein
VQVAAATTASQVPNSSQQTVADFFQLWTKLENMSKFLKELKNTSKFTLNDLKDGIRTIETKRKLQSRVVVFTVHQIRQRLIMLQPLLCTFSRSLLLLHCGIFPDYKF